MAYLIVGIMSIPNNIVIQLLPSIDNTNTVHYSNWYSWKHI